MSYSNCKTILLAGAALSLTACGGGSGGGLNSIPAPPLAPTPTPTPTPTPIPPPPAGPLGLKSDAPFALFSAYDSGNGSLVAGEGAVNFAYSLADDRYTVSLPGFEEGHPVTTGVSGTFNASGWLHVSATSNNVSVGDTSAVQPVRLELEWPSGSDFKFTSMGSWYSPAAHTPLGYFVYGIPTVAGHMPITGVASYAGNIRGLTSDRVDVYGSIDLLFNFGAGTLSGQMKPEIYPDWDPVPLGTYAFRDTVYSTGSTSFSGSFNVPGTSAASAFQGSFNGPGAPEAMGSWNAPYLNPLTESWGSMAGVFRAKKKP